LNRQFGKLVRDLGESLRRWRLWVHLGWNDIAKQYRRSFLGPVWITLNTGIFIVAFSFVGAQLFHQAVEAYLAYFATGTIIFGFFSSLLNEGCAAFTSAESYLKQGSVPKLAFVFRVLVRDLVLLGHNCVIILGALLWLGSVGSVDWLATLAGLLLAVTAAFFAVAILGTVAARFRDIPMIVSSATQVLYFLTPVMWRPEQLTARARWVVVLNPLAIFLDLVRKPILGQPVGAETYLAGLVVIALLAVLFLAILTAARRRIVYWL